MTAGWNALPRDEYQTPESRALLGRKPTPFELREFMRSISGPVPGLYVSRAADLAQLLAAQGDFDEEHTRATLATLEMRGAVICREGCYYVRGAMRDVSAAPTSKNQIEPRAELILGLCPELRAVVQREILDVTARADTQRAKRRKAGVEPLFERLKTALGVQLVSLPPAQEEPPEQQLSLPLGSPRPEVRIVTDTPEKGEYLDYFEATEPQEIEPPSRRPVAPQGGHAAAAVCGQQNDDAGGARGGARQGGERIGELPPRRDGRAGDSRAGDRSVSDELRTDQARQRLERFVEKSRDGSGVARLLVGPDGKANDRDVQRFAAMLELHKQPSDADLDKMAELIRDNLVFGWFPAGVALDWLCMPVRYARDVDRFRELLTVARTPAKKPQGRGGMPQPALSQHDDLGEVFATPRRSAK